MRVRRALQGATAAAVLAALLPISAASAATAPTISSIISNSGTFTSSPGAGKINNPQIVVTGVEGGETVTLNWADGGTQSATCVVAPTFTTITFNSFAGSNCAVPATAQFTLSQLGTFTFVATNATGSSNTFDYIRDQTIPLAPAAPVTVVKKVAASLEVTFGRSPSPGDPGTSPSGIVKYEVLRNDTTQGDGYQSVAIFNQSVCGATTCTYFDDSTDGQPQDAHTYTYAARAIDAAGNVSGSVPNPNPESALVTADGAGPTAPPAPTVTPTSPDAVAGFGNDATPVISVTNSSAETVTIQLVANSNTLGSPQEAAAGATVTWNSATPVATLPADGAYSIQASSTDAVGNATLSPATSYTLDTVNPDPPSISSINDQAGSSTAGSDSTPKVVVGSIADQDRVTLTVDDDDTTPPPGTFAKTSGGTSLTYNPTAGPDDFTITGGDRTVTMSATVMDRAGNASTSSASKTYSLDGTPPAAPSITSVDGDTATPGSGIDRTPRIVVAWQATTATVEIYDGATKVGEKAVGASSPVVFNDTSADSDITLGYGPHTLKAVAKDQAGNASESATFSYDELDNRSPDAPSGVTATQISGTPGRVSLDWSDATDQNDTSGNASPPVYYEVHRAQADPSDNTCPSGTGLSYTLVDGDVATSDYVDAATTAGKCLYYEIRSVDQAGNMSANSTPTSGVLIAATQTPATPVIASVNGDTSSPATGSGAASAKPNVVVTLGEVGGTVTIYVDNIASASKLVTSTSMTISGADWTVAVPVREHTITAKHMVESLTSAESGAFAYGRSPAAPTITSVAGKSTSPAKGQDKKPPVNASLVQNGDTVTLFADGTPVASKNATGSTISFTLTDYTTELSLGTHVMTVKTCDPGVGDCNTVADATSPASAGFTYQRSPVVKGYELDGYGGLHPVGGAPAATGGPYWSGWDIARGLVLQSSGTSGYVLDAFGGIHPFGGATAVTNAPYFGFDIARDIVLITDTSGYVLDGWGGTHPFGGAPALTGGPYFQGFDIARAFVVSAPGKGYVLDGWGATHPVGGAPSLSGTPYFVGNDIARGIVLRTNATSGYILDGLGAAHAFGGAPTAQSTYYDPSTPRAKAILLTEAGGDGGYILDGRGGLNVFGTASTLVRPVTFGFDIARDVAVKLS